MERQVDVVFRSLGHELVGALASAGLAAKSHWLLTMDARGSRLTGVDADEATPPHDLVAQALADGAWGAAYATYIPDRCEVVAEVRVAAPGDSDIRKAVLRPSLGPWEYQV